MGLGEVLSSKAHCEELFRFHRWRLKKISVLLRGIDSEAFSKQLNGSFGSLFIVLKHLVWAEKVWMGRVNPDDVAAMGLDEQDIEEMLNEWDLISTKWSESVSDWKQEDFGQKINFFDSQGLKFEQSLFEIIIHLVDHSTYHIGQMMSTVRSFGFEPVPTNYIHYLRATSGK